MAASFDSATAPARGRTGRPVGTVTRGTTNTNRLRRMDRWIAHTLGRTLRAGGRPPVAVDLGYGAAPWTAVELAGRLRTVRPDVRVVGIEIEPERVTAALPYAEPPLLTFRRGGFEVPLDGGAPAQLIRAANVLRQYDESAVAGVWERLCARLAPDGLLVEGTCDEIGRRHVWVALGPEGPRTVTFAARLGGLGQPSDLAERLPKALIHHNVPGRRCTPSWPTSTGPGRRPRRTGRSGRGSAGWRPARHWRATGRWWTRAGGGGRARSRCPGARSHRSGSRGRSRQPGTDRGRCG